MFWDIWDVFWTFGDILGPFGPFREVFGTWELAAHIAEPITHVYNSSLIQGQYPDIYKSEVSTPVPNKYPIESIDQLRNISGLLIADKVFEKLLSELIISDLKRTADKSQFGIQKSRKRETMNLLTDADSRTDTILEGLRDL